MSSYLETIKYKGVDLVVDNNDWSTVELRRPCRLLPLDGPPVSCVDSGGVVYMHKIEYFSYMISITSKEAEYAIQIEGKWYMPFMYNRCHINILLATNSKLGRAL